MTADNSSMIHVLDDQWLIFANEHDTFNMSLDWTTKAMWHIKNLCE